MSTTAIPLGPTRPLDVYRRVHEDYAAAWIAGYRSAATRDNYKAGIRRWFTWCDRIGIDPMRAGRPHVELFLRSLEQDGCTPRTVANRLTILSSFYTYLVDEEILEKHPARRVERPKIPRKSPTAYLNRAQLSDLVKASRTLSASAHALICILVFNGLRINEACSLNINSLGTRGNFPVLTFVRKGGDIGTAVLGRTTEHAVRAAIGGRILGPLLLTSIGTRMNQQAAQRILERCRPAIENCPDRFHPHVLRHSWTTMAIADGVPMDQIVHDGGWADARMATAVYAHGQDNPTRAASHRVESLVLSL